MDATMYYLELMFNFLSMIQPQKLMNRTMLAEGLFLKNKDKRARKKLGCKFIRINTNNYDKD